MIFEQIKGGKHQITSMPHCPTNDTSYRGACVVPSHLSDSTLRQVESLKSKSEEKILKNPVWYVLLIPILLSRLKLVCTAYAV